MEEKKGRMLMLLMMMMMTFSKCQDFSHNDVVVQGLHGGEEGEDAGHGG